MNMKVPLIGSHTCGNCKYSDASLAQSNTTPVQETRLCKRFPPQVTAFLMQQPVPIDPTKPLGPDNMRMTHQVSQNQAYPVVHQDDQCGEWKPKLSLNSNH